MKCWACNRSVTIREARCPHCRRWGTLGRWRPITAIDATPIQRTRSGLAELDALLGGGFVPGCTYRLTGAPGSGKSTLALDLAARLPSLYATAEEAAESIRLRLERIRCTESASAEAMLIGEISAVEDLVDLPDGVALLVIDSIHRLQSSGVSGPAGSNYQLVHATQRLVELARKQGLVVLLISHVNREGEASGTTGVDHDVDALLELSRPETGGPGALRVKKNRHGPAPHAIAVHMTEGGLRLDGHETNPIPHAE